MTGGDGELLVRDVFSIEDILPLEERLDPPRPGETAAQFLRRAGWEQSHFPDRHRVREERVWTHGRHTPNGPVTFAHALLLAGYRNRRRTE